jgi:hypothetical protein
MTTFEWTDRDGETHEIVPETEWTNYGDVNPRDHGGRFVRWTGRYWVVHETRPPETLPDGLSETEHLVMTGYVDPEEIWVDGDPDHGPTDWLAETIESVHGYSSFESAMLEVPVGYWIADWLAYHGDAGEYWVDDQEWTDWLDSEGIQL